MQTNLLKGDTIPGVSVCIITYNQAAYVAQAIESALMQHIAFETEIIVCDDKSTDGTAEIIQQYANQYPTRIKAYYATNNLGMLRNWQKALMLCKGKYIALLEGDDFWTDPNKLQKQYNILEHHPDCAICFTNATIKYESGEPGFNTYVTITGEKFTAADLLNFNFIPTCSVLMRNNITEAFFHQAYFKSPFADWIIHTLNSKYGSMYFLNEFTCTYRVHGTGVWGGISQEKQLLNRLKGINCVAEILTESQYAEGLRSSKKAALQNLCAYYKANKHYKQYIKHRLALLLN
jgi:glycosyltransferase involved in cell wall biosynthesis